MDFFGIGFPELLLILVVALVVFGPSKIVEIGRGLGKFIYNIRQASSDISSQISRELEMEKQELDKIKKASSDLDAKLTREVSKGKQELLGNLLSPKAEASSVKSGQDSSLPPREADKTPDVRE